MPALPRVLGREGEGKTFQAATSTDPKIQSYTLRVFGRERGCKKWLEGREPHQLVVCKRLYTFLFG